jgi:hypothetical protein
VNANVKVKSMETPASLIESLIGKAEAYGKTTLELTKLRALEITTRVAAHLVSKLSTVIMLIMFSVLLSTGIALLLGDLLGKAYYGFFIVAGIYLVAGIIFYFFLRKWIKKPVSNLMIKQIFQ